MKIEFVTVTCSLGVAEAAERLAEILAARGIQVFAVIDHGAGARGAGLSLPDEVLVLFGDPRVGTALMQDQPLVGYDLPLRMLFWDDGATTTVAYRDPAGLSDEYGLTASAPTAQRLSELMRDLAAQLSS